MPSNKQQPLLDAEELLHLAVLDSRSGAHDDAIDRLKSALVLDPSNANVTFFLAAEHAEIGMYERAISGFQKALELDKDLHTARFQLGLLLYTAGRTDEAETAWTELSNLGDNSALRLFPEALITLAKGELESAKQKLETAIKSDRTNEALTRDMERVLNNLVTQGSELQAQSKDEPESNNGRNSDARHIFLSNYETNSGSDND